MSPNSEEGIISQTISSSSSSSCHYQCIATLSGNSSYVSGLAVDCDSLYVASSDGHIRLWPLDMAMAMVREESTSSSSQGEVSRSTVAVTGSPVKCLAATGDGLVSSHQDGTIRVWRHAGGRRRLALRAVLPTAADCLRALLLPGGGYVEVRRHKRRAWVHHVDAVTALALSPDGESMYSVSWDRSLKAWRLPGLRCAESVAAAHDDAINAVVAAPDGHVYTASADGTVKAWRRRTGQKKLSLVCVMEGHGAAVNALGARRRRAGALLRRVRPVRRRVGELRRRRRRWRGRAHGGYRHAQGPREGGAVPRRRRRRGVQRVGGQDGEGVEAGSDGGVHLLGRARRPWRRREELGIGEGRSRMRSLLRVPRGGELELQLRCSRLQWLVGL
ncbi:hypothetical protein OsJ_20754 [Oryza sativa Japonica Group]|uniref:Uncharacterized protein n=1 Tax=Oryza sativa subsp. japonica TaxID=39947 RepID=A3BA35_ORYSJ|nr:hypothetical protein OsJ_20754 [Oryza sativa Japonica Group]